MTQDKMSDRIYADYNQAWSPFEGAPCEPYIRAVVTKEKAEQMIEVSDLWRAYMNDMRPERRNDFLKAFAVHATTIRALIEAARK